VKKRINVTIGIIISVFFIYLAFRRVELTEIVYSIRQVNVIWVVPNMMVVILTMAIRSLRWKYLLRPIRKYNVSGLFPSVMIGFMANNVLPVRLGEVVRAYSLGKTSGESRSAIFATVVIERIFDSLSLLLMFWLIFLLAPVPQGVRRFGVISLILNVVAIIGLILLKRKRNLIIGLLFRPLSLLSRSLATRMESILGKFADGLSIFGEYKALGVITGWSLILWLATALSNYFIFIAFGYYPNVIASFILLLFVAAAVMLPSAPGFMGVFQAGVIGAFALMNSMNITGYQMSWEKIQFFSLTAAAFASSPVPGMGSICDSLGLFGISKGQALSFSIVLWLSQYIPVTLLGFYYLKREHLTLKISNDRTISGDRDRPRA
jgi:uncharacterized protein (TIRG00374 family)